ncbi:cytochrome P450 [Trichoderma citrinoviride]|uniref:Cytochrome P450 n=1 Tax=Trichoderma citrinoviride TaxID=58853 RepID=A0A2T4B488_9HYPO|nr:cytochrome P450 [Trichoderma citrinoviride]PTB64110.1 cytochrome P450 [Trichoderma citrinoviride]
MGFLEALAHYVSVKAFVLVTVALWMARIAINRIREHRKIKSIGNYGHTLQPRLPFGLDFIYYGVRSTIAHKNLELWRDIFFGGASSSPSPSYTCEMRILNERVVLTADPENVKAMLATQFHDFGKGPNFNREWAELLGDSIFTTDGAQWHDSRQLLRPQFTRVRLSDLHCFEAHIQALFKAMANGGPLNGENQEVDLSGADGRRLDISELFYRYTLDVATDFLLGSDVKSLSTPKHDIADAFAEAQRLQNIMVRASRLRWLTPKGAYRAHIRTIDTFVNGFIQRALRMSPDELAARSDGSSSNKGGYTFLHALAGFTRDPKVLRDQILAVLIAGRDTTAATMSWAIYELSRHPHAVRRLRTEILETVGPYDDGNRLPTYEHLKNMPYLRAVLNETLRLYPAVPFNLRVALKDTTLPRGGGPDGAEPLPVLKGTRIGYSTLVMHRRPDLYPPASEAFADPAVFSPERWAVWHPRPHDYIPFNAGPRICIGQQLALTEMSYTLCRIFQRFERVQSFMAEIDGGNPLLKSDIILSPGHGVHVAFWEAKKGTN